MSEPNPDEVGNVPDSPEWTTAQPRDGDWVVPHEHSADQGRFDQHSPAAGGPANLPPTNQPPTNQPPLTQPYAGQQSHPAQPAPGQTAWNQYGQGQNQPGSYPLYPGQTDPGGYPPQFPQAPPGGAWSPPLRSDYAHWGRRVGAYLIDFAPTYVGLIFFWVWYVQFIFRMIGAAQTQTFPTTDIVSPVLIIGVVIILLGYVYIIWNRYFLDGRRGQTLGKRALKIRLISETTGEPIGALNAFLRDLVHTLDGASYVGYLWPLWDDKRQTFADKLMKTIVVDAQRAPDTATAGQARSTCVG